MSRTTLTEARIRALKPRKTAYVLRDSKLRGFGVRMLPSGRKRFFVHCQHRGERVWKIVGDAATMDVREARSRATAMLAAIRRGEDVSCETAEGLFEGRRRDSVPASRAGLEVGDPLREPMLPAQSAPAALCRAPGSRTSAGTTVRNWFASLHAHGRLRRIAPCRCFPSSCGRRKRWALRPEGSNPWPGHQAIPPEGARTLPVRRRDPPVVRNAVGPMRTVDQGRLRSSAFSCLRDAARARS